MRDRREIETQIRNTPMFSHSAMRLIEVTNDDDHSLRDVVKIVEADSVLTAQIFKIVNSAAFGFSGAITSISRAAALLGDKTIVGLAIGQSQSQLYNSELQGYHADAGSLWAHCLRCAIASRELANYTAGKVSSELAYTAGILHDIGKSLISNFIKGKTEILVKNIDDGNATDFLHAERRNIGIDHCQAGSELARHWRFPEPLVAACGHHHAPKEASPDHRALLYVVHLGDIIAMMGGSATGADGLLYAMDENYKEYVDLDADGLHKVLMNVTIEFERTKDMIAV